MTIDEAIKHAEEVAIEQDKLCKRYDDASGYTRSHNEEIRTSDAKKCEKCASEHRQLAEWLKDYKRLKEQESVLDKIRAEIENLEEGISSYHNDRPWIYKDEVLQIIDKYKAEMERGK